MAGTQTQFIARDRLHAAVLMLLNTAGCGEREAELISVHLVEANLRGHDSHGVNVLPMYIRAIRGGGMVLNQTLNVALDTGAMLICDAGRGAGQVMAHDAMALGIARAQDTGSAIVSLRNSHHIGRIGHWAEQCAAAGMVSVHFVNVVAGPYVAPFGGTRARLGTNPFAAGFPRERGSPLVVDFATSRLAAGKIKVAFNKGSRLPDGALLDASGSPTNDPADLYTTPPGTLLPFGEHKGFGLMLVCELLGAAVVGAPTQSLPDRTDAVINSMFSVIVSPQTLGTAAPFASELEAVLAWVLSENDGDADGVLLPGMPELRSREQRLAEGIPLDLNTIEQLDVAARIVGLPGFDPS